MAEKKIYFNKDGKLHAKTATLRVLPEEWVRVQPKSVAVNPTDYKHCIGRFAEGASNGSDFAGVVTEVGSKVTDVKVGDFVAGVGAGNNPDMPEDGAYATVIDLPPHSVMKFPHLDVSSTKHIDAGLPTTFEQASTLGISVATVAIAFSHYNKTPLVKDSCSGYALIYGAASALGFQAVQISTYLGYTVIAVASKKHEQLLKGIGAAHVVEYHDDDWVEQVRAIGGDDITYAYDTIAFNETFHKVYQAVSHTKPVKINLSLWAVDEPTDRRDNVQYDTPLLYLLWMDSKSFAGTTIPGIPELKAARPEIFKQINQLFTEKVIKAIPTEVVGEGFDEIPNLFTAFERGASANKFVVRL